MHRAPGAPEPTRTASAGLSLLPAFQGGVYVPFDSVVLSSTNGAVVTANGNAAVSSVGTAFRGASVDGDGNLTSFAADLTLHTAVTLDVGVTTAGEFSTSVGLPPLALPPFEIGPNIVVSPFAYVTFTLEGTADGVAHASVVMPFETGVTLAST